MPCGYGPGSGVRSGTPGGGHSPRQQPSDRRKQPSDRRKQPSDRRSQGGGSATTPRRSDRRADRAASRTGEVPAASATWSHRSMSWRVDLTKSPGVTSRSSSTDARSPPSAQAYAARAKPASSSRRMVAVAVLDGDQLTTDAGHLAQCGPYRCVLRWMGGHRVGLPCLVHERGQAGRQLCRAEAVPDAAAKTFGGDQVQLVVQPGQRRTGRGEPFPVQVPQLAEHITDVVERAAQRVGPGLDPGLQLAGLPLGADETLGRPGVLLAVGAPVARVRADGGAQPMYLVVVGRRGHGVVAADRVDVLRTRPQLGGQRPTLLRVARVERRRNLDPRHGHHRPEKSATDNRRACRCSVMTTGRGSLPARPGSTTTARPAHRRWTSTTSPPGASTASRDVVTTLPAPLVLGPRHHLGEPDRNRAYSAASPRSQVMAERRVSASSVARRACRASPTTARSDWNCAKDD